MTEETEDLDNIFEDALSTIFGDVKVSHGEPGELVRYQSKTHK
jgi:hypothetical protein